MQLHTRDRQDEWMDQPDLDGALHAKALRGLSRVNRFSGAVGAIWQPIARLSDVLAGRPIRVLDVACGGGDVAIGLKRLADRKGIEMEIVGCDLSDTAVAFAGDNAKRRGADVAFVQHDALSGDLPAGFDVVYSSLFLHHLEAADVVRLLAAMRSSARHKVVISDLLRSQLGYLLAKWGIRLLTTSKVCHVDGPLSVRAAWTISEASQLAAQAGLTPVQITRRWPERFLMVYDAGAPSG
ncbi:methyltransferase domain-containing protein [Rhodopirellula sp. JC639]|uniref:methyltransferase domain-containing protein n=1 Tax=Stieleria mannarensis TaxID=2755585 RepID=UPI001600F563|nr:methyltransferase domain-containing protein [Rhodopirellula sp. JC639]